MASHSEPRIYKFKHTAAIAKGKAVKLAADSDGTTVVVGAANTDKCIGIIQNAASSDLEGAEVALPGGGAKALLGEAVEAGDSLVCHTDGSLVAANAEGDRVIAVAMQAGASGDLISVEVVIYTAHAAE